MARCGRFITALRARALMSTTMTVHLDDEINERQERSAASALRNRSFPAAEAIHGSVAHDEWQSVEIEVAVVEANAAAFAPDRELSASAYKWRGSAAQVAAHWWSQARPRGKQPRNQRPEGRA